MAKKPKEKDWKKEYKSELEKAKKENPQYFKGYIKRNELNKHFIEAVYCKCCGCQIKGLVKDRNGHSILQPFWNYTEVLLEFEDGSAHLTPMCRKCSNNINTKNMKEIYLADLEELEREETPTDNTNWEIYAGRLNILCGKAVKKLQ